MIRLSTLGIRAVSIVEPGELVRISFGANAALAILLQKRDNGRILFGILQSDVFSNPLTWHDDSPDEFYLSYGLDWIVEEVHGPETASRGYYAQQKEGLWITATGIAMQFRAPEQFGRHGFVCFNLERHEMADIDSRAAPIDRWRIWENAEHLARGGEPLFEMPIVE